MPDIQLECQEADKCKSGGTFTFTERDQQFFQSQGYEQPKRCKPCREAKKARVAKALNSRR